MTASWQAQPSSITQFPVLKLYHNTVFNFACGWPASIRSKQSKQLYVKLVLWKLLLEIAGYDLGFSGEKLAHVASQRCFKLVSWTYTSLKMFKIMSRIILLLSLSVTFGCSTDKILSSNKGLPHLPLKLDQARLNHLFKASNSQLLNWTICHTVDAQNPAPARMIIIPLFIGF